MGKLAEMMQQERKPAIKFLNPPPRERNEIFSSEGFNGFRDFLGDEPEGEFSQFEQQKKSFLSIIQSLLKMLT